MHAPLVGNGDMETPLSCYILTLNNEKTLAQVLGSLAPVADEIVVVDSGSKDKTKEIAEKFGCRWLPRTFDNFVSQRNFAQDQCTHDWVFFVDSDEVIDQELAQSLLELKKKNFRENGRALQGGCLWRKWYLFGREVRAFLPVTSPDCPMRIFNRHIVRFHPSSHLVHEEPSGQSEHFVVEKGFIHHYSCDSVFQLYQKLNLYTSLAAKDMKNKGKKSSWSGAFIHGFGAWLKWYFKKGGFKDGSVGFLLGIYAFFYTFQKYVKLMFDEELGPHS